MQKKSFVFSFDGLSGTGKSQIMRKLLWLLNEHYSLRTYGLSENLIAPKRPWLSQQIDIIRDDDSLSFEAKHKKEDELYVATAVEDRVYLTHLIKILQTQGQGQIILLDRWLATCMAYQGLYDLSPQFILDQHLSKEIIIPDINCILMCTVNTAYDRLAKRTTKEIRGTAGKMSKGYEKKIMINEKFLSLEHVFQKNGIMFRIINTEDELEVVLHKVMEIILNDQVQQSFNLNKNCLSHKLTAGFIKLAEVPEQELFDQTKLYGVSG